MVQVSAQTLPGSSTTRRPAVSRRSVVGLALTAALSVAPYLTGVLIPYYVNDLDELPLSEVASGLHDPKDLWPQGFVGGWVQLGGYLSLALSPVVLLAVIGVCGTQLITGRPRDGAWRMSAPVAIGLLTVMAACAGALVFLFSPMGSALAVWRMD